MVKKTGSQRSSSHGRDLSSFQSWKRARAGNQENSGGIDSFQGYTILNEITRDDTHDQAVETPYPRATHPRNSRGRIGGVDVIHKNVTVTVTYGASGTSRAATSNSHDIADPRSS